MPDDRIYTVYPYQVGKPPTAQRRGKFWMILAVIVCYAILVVIVVLVVLLSPTHSAMSGHLNRTEIPTSKPFKPSQRDPVYDIDPRTSLGSSDRSKYRGKIPEGWDERLSKYYGSFHFNSNFYRLLVEREDN